MTDQQEAARLREQVDQLQFALGAADLDIKGWFQRAESWFQRAESEAERAIAAEATVASLRGALEEALLTLNVPGGGLTAASNAAHILRAALNSLPDEARGERND